MRILVTGGAGFIGSRLVNRLATARHTVTVLDLLSPQVHGTDASFSGELRAAAECIKGDICDRELVADLTRGKEVVVHLAAETGTGQSMYAIRQYERVNIAGTATLLDVLINEPSRTVNKIVVASSRAVYGEGKYVCPTHGEVYPNARSTDDLSRGCFDMLCAECGAHLQPAPTPEGAPFAPSSFYGLTKQVQEQMILMFASALGLSGLALRFQNVYGPGQSLANPYTGLLGVFCNLARDGKPLNVFEDGQETRDFVYVEDAVDAAAKCVDPAIVGIRSLNVGSGVRTTVLDVAQRVSRHFGDKAPIRISGQFRVGDIRHNVADVEAIHELTGFSARWSFGEGLAAFLRWVDANPVVQSGFEQSLQELRLRGLLGGKK